MHIVVIVVSAMLLGFIYNWVVPTLTPYIPAFLQGNKWGPALVTGAFIFASVFAVGFLLSVAGLKKSSL